MEGDGDANVFQDGLADPKPPDISEQFKPTEDDIRQVGEVEDVIADVDEATLTQVELTAHQKRKKVKELKGERTKLYASITRMNNDLGKGNGIMPQTYWDTLLDSCKGTKHWILKIMSDLSDLAGEDDGDLAKVRKYLSALDANIDGIAKLRNDNTQTLATTGNLLDPLINSGAFTEGLGDKEKLVMGTVFQLDQKVNSLLCNKAFTPFRQDEPDYRGLQRLEVKSFDGDAMKYHFFKTQFKAANEGRNLSQVELALRLHKHLKGKPEKLVETHLHTNLGQSTYTLMWKLLDNRYGGGLLGGLLRHKHVREGSGSERFHS